MEFKPDTIEALIFFLAHYHVNLKNQKVTLVKSLSLGLITEEEDFLMDAIIIDIDKLSGSFEKMIESLCARTEKGDHILLSLVQALKEKE